MVDNGILGAMGSMPRETKGGNRADEHRGTKRTHKQSHITSSESGQVLAEEITVSGYNEVWFRLKDGFDELNVKMCNKGDKYDASVNGYRLGLYHNAFRNGGKDYFVSTWGGCTLAYNPNECAVISVESASNNMYLLNAKLFDRLLVLDRSFNSALTAANYVYSSSRSKTDSGVSNKTVTLVNLDIEQNLGMMNIYTMINGTIPPHSPTELMPDTKMSVWIGLKEYAVMLRVLEKYIQKFTGYVIVYANYTKMPPEVLRSTCELFSFACCFTPYKLAAFTEEILCGVQDRMLLSNVNYGGNDELTLNDHVSLCVFRNPSYNPHHFDAHKFKKEEFKGNICRPVPAHLRPIDNETDIISKYNCKSELERNGVYAVTFYNNDDDIFACWGLMYVDYNLMCHSVLPDNVLMGRKGVHLFFLDFCVLS